MKNFTPYGRLLLLAVFLLSATALSAQQPCNLDPGLISISVENTCTDASGNIEQPYVTIDFGSTAVDGMTEITIESFFLNSLNLGTYTIPVEVVFGFTTFELPGFAIGTPNNYVRLNEIEDLETGCVQTFGAGDVESNFYSLTTAEAITVSKDNTRSIDPPCADIPTGKLSVRVTPTDGMYPINRFTSADVRLVPSSFATFISIIPPGTSPNPNPAGSGYYIIETNQSLVSGEYAFLIYDNVRNCEVAFEGVVGDPANNFGVLGQSTEVSCFGETDGSITIIPQNADPQINGFLYYTLSGPNGLQRTGTIAASNGVYNMPTESNLEAGDYNLILTASNGGCTGEDAVTIGGPDEIVVSDLAADAICADDASFEVTASGISGIDAGARYRFIDATIVDADPNNDNGCWNSPVTGDSPLSSAANGDGTYTFVVGTPGTGFCRAIDQDTTVALVLEVKNVMTNCLDTFMVDLQIYAMPAAPVVDATANVNGSIIDDFYCSGQDIALDIADYDPAFTYEISYTGVPGVSAGGPGAAPANDTFPYVDGNTVISFANSTDYDATIDFTVTKTNVATGCTSAVNNFSTRVRAEPVLTSISGDVLLCSDEAYSSGPIEVNNGNNGSLSYNYEWSYNTSALSLSGALAGNEPSGNSVTGTFTNTSGTDQVANLIVTPVYVQQNAVVSGGLVDNTCEGQPVTINVTISAQPDLAANLVVGQNISTTLAGGETVAEEICSGETFTLNNLMVAETSGTKAKYVRFEVAGDASFLQIPAGQGPQYFPIQNFAININNVVNTDPNNNAQVATLTLTPYFEDDENNPGSNPLECAGEPIVIILTINPTPPFIADQTETVCSGERIEYTIGTGSMSSNLETRITTVTTFDGFTEFTVPEGADRIEDFTFTITGADGGAANGFNGGQGGQLEGMLSSTELLPGDVIRVRKGTAGEAGTTSGNGGDATTMVVIAGGNHMSIAPGTMIYQFVAGGGGGAGFAQSAGDVFPANDSNSTGSDGVQGQGGGGAGGTGFPTALGGDGMTNGGGGGGGWSGGNGGSSLAGAAGLSGSSYASTLSTSPTFVAKASGQADGEVLVSYTIVYDDIRFEDVVVDFDADSLTNIGETIVNGEVDTILFGQQFVNNTNNPQDVTYTLTPVTQANCGDMSTVEVVVTIEPQPMVVIESGSTTTVTGNAIDGFEATVCSGDSINAVLNSLTAPSLGSGRLYFEVATATTSGTAPFGNNNQAASNSTDFGGNNTGDDLPIDFFETGVSNNTGVDGTITYTITPYIRAAGPDCAGDPITFTVTVQPGFTVNSSQPLVNVCSREPLNTVFDLDASQTGSINIAYNNIRVTDLRVSSSSSDFTLTGLDTTGLAAGGVMLDRTGNFFNDAFFTNRTGGGVGVEIDVVFISGTGCESPVVTYDFNVRAEPIIDESNTEVTVCEGEPINLSVMAAANSVFANNFAPNDVTFSYTLDAGSLIHTGNTYPTTGNGAFYFQGDSFENPTSTPQTATYTVVATSRNACVSQPVTYTITVLPSPELTVTASQGDSTITGEELLADIETLTICSGSSVDFALSQDVTGTDVSYRVQRVVTGSVTDGDGSAIDNFEGGLAIADFQETLVNSGTGAATVQYNIAAYTYGGDGMDGDGLNASDDCQGITKRLIVEVLPATTDEASLATNLTIDNPNTGTTNPGNGAQICDNSEVVIRPLTTVDPITGAAFVWRRENDGTPLGGVTSGNGTFLSTVNGNNFYPAAGSDLIRQVLTAEDDQTTEVRYIVTLYSFGTNGVDDMLAPGSDDCMGDIDTITLQLDPTPELSYDLEIGTAAIQRLDQSGSPYTFEICSGEDFLIDNLDIPELADNKFDYVELRATGDVDFLGLPAGGPFVQVAPVGSFTLGAQNVQTTNGNNSAQTTRIRLTPYFEDGVDTNSRDADECGGEDIVLIVTLNPTPDPIAPASATFCSDELTQFPIPTSGNNFRSRVAKTEDFSSSNDYVVPPGVFSIRNINLTITGGNGGASGNGALRGGLGRKIEIEMNESSNPNQVLPGDTIRVRKAGAGTDGSTFGDGGDATLLYVIAGSTRGMFAQGDVMEVFVAAGGGGAGQAFAGQDALGFSTNPSSPAAADGNDGIGLGGFGGAGFDAMDLNSGSLGGSGRGNGGGGGGGWAGGDGGDNTTGMAGDGGTSYASTVSTINPNTFTTKDFGDAAAGDVSMDFTLVYDDVVFTLINRSVGMGLIDLSAAPLTVGDSATDTILFGERFENPTDTPIDVVYTFSTSSEANCPGSEVIVTLTIEPNPTLELAGNGTTVFDDGNNNYSAAICSGEGISATISSDVIPSDGAAALRARVLTTTAGNGTVTFGNDVDAASQSSFFNGNNRPSVTDVNFFETEVSYDGTDTATVTYQIIPVIISGSTSGAECFGDTITFTVSVYPEFLNEEVAPAQVDVCSNVSLADAGFDVDAEQSAVLVAYDSIIIDTVYSDISAANAVNFETISSSYAGSPAMVLRSEGFFGADTYRNRTGGPVVVTYEVRLVSGPDCSSDLITYEFRYAAEPVIDIVESATNQIDTTICTGSTTGLEVFPAANSAFPTTTGTNAFQNRITIEYDINLPAGITLTKTNGSYPATGGRNYMKNDELTNTTASPLDVTYTVKVANGACAGDSVVYTVTVNPNPFADVTLMSMDSTETFGLDNARLGFPNPEFGVCSGAAVTAVVPATSTSAAGTLMVNFEVTTDDDGISGYPLNTIFNFPASELADSLSYAAGELVNMTGASQLFTVEYRAYIEANGTPGFQNDGIDCQSDGIIQFDVVINPVNGAFAQTEMDGTGAAFPAGADTICSGQVFDLLVRNSNSAGVAVDSFIVDVTDAGLDAIGSTPTGTFTILGAATATNGVRSQDFAYTNTTPGIKTVTYIVTPYSGECVGTPDTTTVSYRAEIDLIANESVLCADPGVATSLFAIDVNGGMISDTPGEYRYEYIGGTAAGYSLERGTGGGVTFVGDPNTQANTIVYNNQRSVTITPSSNASAFTPGTVNFEVIYNDSANGCGVITDTITLNFQTTAEAGMADQGLGILCDDVNFVLNNALIGEDQGGVFSFTNGDPGLGVLNGANFTPMVGGADATPVAIDFTYTVGGGNSGCATAAVDFTIMVEPAPNAGTYDGTIGEACQSAPVFNLFSLLDGEMQNGTFTQTGGVDFVTVNPDGTINQDNISPGAYEFSYEVVSANGCGSDIVTGIMVQVNSREDCSTFVPCDVIELKAGFNTIAFDVMPNDNTVETIFADEIASNNLLTVVALYAEVGQPQSYTFVPGFGGINNIQGGLRPGYGYIVEVATDATIEICGAAVDTDLRVELLAGLNIVGYAGSSPESVFSYFDELISNSDLVLARSRTNNQTLETIFQPFVFGNLLNVENSTGYIIDVNSAYGNGTWRDNGPLATSAFDRLYGVIENGEEFVGEMLTFTDAEGMVVGQTEVLEGGIYMNTFLFGDLETTERLREGLAVGETFFANLRGEQVAADLNFSGNWKLTRLDLNFSNLSTEAEIVEHNSSFSMEVFPNPTQDFTKLELNLPTEYESVHVELFSLFGQMISEQTIDQPGVGLEQIDLDLSGLPAGTYQVRITAAAEILANRQVVKQ
ncbi:T9SS type A sorting domain-containing protein [Neolewinella aurantiaca]|uniref:T9SS type A sorting domain-containing protein n=1 Tax=Neolewinella aurantiaca TaxID=2602767 RepID=A0A5C7FF44_9BACT|nr:PKD-like domain-containing protein [Neolewinella aurantiaca]TXF88880.1 T9SS type A sorting domain-containing protein [Neolewinella aurantiaca]